ncbi:hypothetical protein EDD53_2943 [Pacificibacter maritimus]|uniref:HTH luxR-type domain-containing protein n=1 Tax=Pacificibacter maritimus TaxID=762213 RepID=A0A3N4UQD9_9RHOB|nr:hypothetical protein [Pacificibacter maritimus]RPE62904.1 hypothetical protein EDD53_2943 [Pacificibacter maritimus]
MSDETQLLTALFNVALGQTSDRQAATGVDGGVGDWTGFLSVLARISHADTVQLHLIDSAGVQRWQLGDDLGTVDIQASDKMRTSRVYSQSDLPSGLDQTHPLRSIRWRNGADAWGILTLRRRADDFRAADSQHLSNLLPYLAPTVHGWQALMRTRLHNTLSQQTSAALGAAWILFAQTGQMTATAEGLPDQLEAVAGIKTSADGRLLLDPEAAQQMRAALNAIAAGETAPQAVRLSASGHVQMILSVMNYGGDMVVVGCVRFPKLARDLPLSRVMDVFALNRSEARLAVALCDGLTLAQAAETLGWTIETARSTSKQLFAHMGVSGQPSVVRAMQSSAIWF